MAKPGCGALAAILLVLVALIAVGTNEGVGYYFSHCDIEDEDIFDCLLDTLEDEEEEAEEGTVAAAGTYEYKDYSVNITMNIPLQGGAVTGSVSGACDGRVKGDYTGAEGGLIQGKLTGTCDPFFVKIPASADFSGSVNKRGKSVSIQFTGRGGGIEHSGSMSLGWSDEPQQ